jgi:hypothetical protein
MDTRPDDHDRPGGLSHDMPCGHCGHPAHPIEACDRCTCQEDR